MCIVRGTWFWGLRAEDRGNGGKGLRNTWVLKRVVCDGLFVWFGKDIRFSFGTCMTAFDSFQGFAVTSLLQSSSII